MNSDPNPSTSVPAPAVTAQPAAPASCPAASGPSVPAQQKPFGKKKAKGNFTPKH